jgi:drug/metabolite transporter (DMT)-like permease
MSESVGIIAAVITLCCWTVGTFSFTTASELFSPKSINRVRLLYATLLLTIVVCIWRNMNLAELFTLPLPEHWLWLGVSGVVGLSIGDYFAFSAYKMMGSSRTSLFSTFAPGAALFGGILFLGERLNVIGLVGMTISVGGLIWFILSASAKQKGIENKDHLTKGIVYAILGALCQGLGLVFAKKGLVIDTDAGRLMPLHATWIRMFSATIIIYLIGFFRGNLWTELKAVSLNQTIFRPVIIGTIFGPVIGVSTSLYAASVIEVSLAQTIFSLLPISVMLAAVVLGREKLERTSLIAAFIGVAGVFVLVWRKVIEYWLF